MTSRGNAQTESVELRTSTTVTNDYLYDNGLFAVAADKFIGTGILIYTPLYAANKISGNDSNKIDCFYCSLVYTVSRKSALYVIA